MADIFISYASENRERVIPIVKALEEQGWSTFWDWKSIPVGKTWREFIDEGLEAARCILVLWSTISTTKGKRWVVEEADYGLEHGKLIPALIDDVRPPIGFGQIQAAKLINWTGDINNAEFKKLVDALESILGPSPKHTRGPAQATEEERKQKQEEEKKREEEERRKAEEKLRFKEERKRVEAERKAEEERKRKEIEAKRKTEEEPKRKQAEEKSEHARKAEAERKAEEERKRKADEEEVKPGNIVFKEGDQGYPKWLSTLWAFPLFMLGLHGTTLLIFPSEYGHEVEYLCTIGVMSIMVPFAFTLARTRPSSKFFRVLKFSATLVSAFWVVIPPMVWVGAVQYTHADPGEMSQLSVAIFLGSVAVFGVYQLFRR